MAAKHEAMVSCKKQEFEFLKSEWVKAYPALKEMNDSIERQVAAIDWCLQQARTQARKAYQRDRWQRSKFRDALVSAGMAKKHADVVTKWQVDFMETADKEHAFAACSHAVESSRFVFGPEPAKFDPSQPTVWLPTSPGVQKLHELLKEAQEPLNIKKDMLCTTMSKNLRWPSSQGPHSSDLGLASGFDIFEASKHADQVIELWKWICVHIVF